MVGKLPSNFNEEKVLRTFRTNLGVDGSAVKESGVKVMLSIPKSIVINIIYQRQSIFDSFSAYLSDVKHSLYNNLSPSSEIDEHIAQAREELLNIDDELSRVLTQQLVLRKRQADLGIYIEKSLNAKVCIEIDTLLNVLSPIHLNRLKIEILPLKSWY